MGCRQQVKGQYDSSALATTGARARDVCIVSAVRTPFGSLQGSLASLSATQLGALAIKGALERIKLDPEHVQEVFMGNVVSAGLGQAPARQAALGAGLPLSVACTTINKVCSSGLKAVMLGALSIQAGVNDVVIAGGMESMSNIPYYIPQARGGLRMGHKLLVDGMIKDGLWDAYHDMHMGECAEQCAIEYGFSRAQQDDHAIESVHRATKAALAGITSQEVVPVEVPGRKGEPPTLVTADEALAKMDPERLRILKPAFAKEHGTVTAGNASPITDGAAALILMSNEKASMLGLPVLGHLRGMGDAAQDPRRFATSPALAIPKALAHAGLQQDQVDFYEINEAFSVVDLANQQLLGLDSTRVNAHGGAVALGHPVGASGAAILVRLLNVLDHNKGRIGVAAICNGGGGASAVVVQRTHATVQETRLELDDEGPCTTSTSRM
ncbi:hypothetical protein WJX72_011932 [[Myrmecia] bisecta]|uniref:acetyl-CoA C-acetyltransferase n=1 Tax=[Myrmecia] bisecta TaxID=41462 RepID=A0AAW1PYT2_9CHLO